MVKIITDSACDIPLDQKLNNVEIMNFHININGKDYEERKDFTIQEFYDILEKCEHIPTTAHITMVRFCEKYFELHNQGVTDIIHVTINKTGSATHDAAIMAKNIFKQEFPESKMNISIIDSGCYSLGYGYPIICANDMIDTGVSAEKVIEYFIERFDNTEILLATYTLKFMKKSGRISAAAAFAGELMGFRPIISMIKGNTQVLQKVRGDKLVIPELIAQFKQRSFDYQDYIIGYTKDEYGDILWDECVKEIGYPPKGRFYLGSAVSINAGPQSVGIAFNGKSAKNK